MKEFVTAARVAEEQDDEYISFKVDDIEVHAYEPSPGQLAMMYSSLSDHARDEKRIAGVVDFFFGLLDSDQARILGARLLDRNDSFELEQITEIMGWLVEEWAARPTRPSSASSASPTSTGRKSTARSQKMALTPGSTASTVSAT